jgi:hypothetical protein
LDRFLLVSETARPRKADEPDAGGFAFTGVRTKP